ncbi:MAG: Xaa-Pro peptidase family protein [Candidatus Aenigmatarchaeota archaeon]
MRKLKDLASLASRRGLDAIFISQASNVRYFTGIAETQLLLVVPRRDEPFVLTSSLGKADIGSCGVEICSVGPDGDIRAKSFYAAAKKKLGSCRRIGFEAGMPHDRFLKMQRIVRAKFKDISSQIAAMRAVKSEDEVAKIRRALEIAEKGMKVARDFIRDGATEREVAAAAEGAMRLSGADWFSFSSIVASGPNPARPHFIPSDRKIGRSDLVVVDIGAVYDGYCSDITRTFCARPSPKQKRLYNIVLRAQAAAEAKARPGVAAAAVDAAARNAIKKAGYGKEFVHATGHGVGLDIHEEPSISPKSKGVLKPGMVFTIEPGIYTKDMGVRLEDMVLLTRKGKIILNRFPKELEV